LDPVVHLTLRACLALLLGVAAWHKLADLARFRAVLAGYDVMPVGLVAVAAPLVVLVEVFIALGIGAGFAKAALAAAVLLAGYAALIKWSIGRGRAGIDCGCMGPSSRMPLSPLLVARNLIVAFAALVATLPPAPRALGAADAASVAAAVAVLTLLWAASERLLALAPRMDALRRRPA